MTILLVEDEALIALAEAHQLEKAGYAVLRSPTGEEAVELVESASSPIDLILMDINLGRGMDGTQAAREILRAHDIPIIFLSSHTELETVRKTEEIANFGYVVKGTAFAVLDASIRMALNFFEAKRQLAIKSAEIEETKKQFRSVMESTSEGLWDWDILTGGIYLSPGFYSLLGYDADTLHLDGSQLTHYIHPDDLDPTLEAYEDCVDNKRQLIDIDFRVRTKNEDLKWIASRGRAVERNADGKATRMMGVYADITDRIRRDGKYQLLYKSIIDAIVEFDLEGHILECNLAFEDIVGYSLAELRSMKIHDLTPVDRHDREVEIIRKQVLQRGHSDIFETEYRKENGTLIPIEARIVLLSDETGNPKTLWSIVRDISYRKTREKALDDRRQYYYGLLNALGDGIVQVNSEGVVVYSNPAAERLLGLAEGSLVGQPMLTYCDAEGKRLLQTKGVSAVKHETAEPILVTLLRADGEPRSFSFTVSGIYDGSGDAIGVSAVYRDVTEQIKTAEYLRLSAEREKVLQMELAHRVKNSLAMVSSLLMIASDDVEDQRSRKVLADTESRLDAMSAIYEQLYTSENIQSIDIGTYVRSLAQSIFETYAANSTMVKLDVDVQHLELDTKRAISLGLITNELLTNALKYAFPERDSGLIRIRLEASQRDISLTVSDNGVGMDPQVIQTSGSMGMTLIRMLTKQMGGVLELAGTRGTSVSIILER